MDDLLTFKEYTLFYTIGIFGLICSITSLIFIIKRPILHHAFGYICAAHSVAEAGVLGMFVALGAYSAFNPKRDEESPANFIMMYICVFFYYGGLYLHLLKSLNRFCAIIFPIKYRNLFSNSIIKRLILMAFGMGFLHSSPLFFHECSAYFSRTTYFITTMTFECESTIVFFNDFITGCTTMAISLSCDIAAFTYFRMRSKKATAHSRNDFKLALHAYLTTTIYMTMIFSFNLFSRFATNRWTLFLTITFAWISGHTLNQLSFIIFVKFLQRKKRTSVVFSG